MIPYTTIAKAYVLVPDCDDDRVNHRTGEPVNPRHERAQADVYGTGREWDGSTRRKVCQPGDYLLGWYPAMTIKVEGGVRSELPWQEARDNEALERPRQYPAGFHAGWYRNDGDGTHRITLWGGDDCSYERGGLSEARARVLWSRLRDFVTLKTLFRLGFRGA